MSVPFELIEKVLSDKLSFSKPILERVIDAVRNLEDDEAHGEILLAATKSTLKFIEVIDEHTDVPRKDLIKASGAENRIFFDGEKDPSEMSVADLQLLWKCSPNLSETFGGSPALSRMVDVRHDKKINHTFNKTTGSNFLFPWIRLFLHEDRKIPVRINGKVVFERKWLVPYLQKMPSLTVKQVSPSTQLVREAHKRTLQSKVRNTLTRLAYVRNPFNLKKVFGPT